MKKLLYTFLLLPLGLFAQTNSQYIEQDRPLNLFEGWNMIGFTCNEPIDVVDAFLPIVDKVIIAKDNYGGAYLPEFGFNGIGFFEYGYGYQLKLTESISDFQFCPFLVPLIEGCMDETAFNYNLSANLDDGSCYPVIYGCLDPTAFNFNDYDGDFESNELTGINGVDINTNNGFCIAVVEGCTDPNAYNFTPFANTNDGSCEYYGCMDSLACNYNPEANIADGSCEYAEQGYDCDGNITAEIGDVMEGGYLFYIDETGQHGLVAATEDIGEFEWGCYGTELTGADGQAIGTGYQNTLDIVSGCSETPIAASVALAYESDGYSDWYLPSFDELKEMFNTIGNGGSEYNIGGFSSTWYWSSSEYSGNEAWFVHFDDGSTVSYGKNNAGRFRVIRSFGNWTMGCMDSLACNFNPEANMADGICEYAELGYDCDGNSLEGYFVGKETEGGIVFYVDETGEHGLVVAMEDLEGVYEWGCWGGDLDGADGESIGTGYQNTLEIVSGCSETPIAASEALAYESDGYSDWYLPSFDELKEMFNTIGNGGSEDNIGGFSSTWYWSSSEYSGNEAWFVHFDDGSTVSYGKNNAGRFRVIRSFGNWTMGCMDSLACNYNPEANMADGSCTYAELGYDCDGNDNCYYPTDPSFLSYFESNYENLIYGGCLDTIAALDITELYWEGSSNDSIESMDGLQFFKNLSDLMIVDGFPVLEEIADFSNLHSLNSIWFDIHSDLLPFPDLSPEAEFNYIDLYGCYSFNSDFVSFNIDTIILGGGCYYPNAQLPDFLAPTSLTSLIIDGYYGLTNIPDLSGLTNLETLYLEGNNNLECVGGYPEQLTIEESWPPVCPSACPYDIYLEYSPDAISYNANLCQTPIVYGCTDNTALNFNSDANVDDNSCEFIYGCIDQEADNYNSEATTDDGSCIYYGCTDPTAGNYDEAANTDDGTCLIGGCMNFTAENYNPDAAVDDGSCVIYGCVLDLFPNYNSVATSDDGSCDMNSLDVFGCTDELTLTYQDFATIDNGICYYGPLPEIGDLILGGIVFYIDETGEHGLLAALEDIGQFNWGCYGTSISGADGMSIGTGYQNTLDIVEGCSDSNSAAFNALQTNTEGYTDWYLPSKDELLEMHSTIGNGGSEGNIGGFENSRYWSSSEDGNNARAWLVRFSDGDAQLGGKGTTYRVRVIRSF